MGSDSDDGAIVREATPEVELGPPLELSAPFVPRPATESLWLIRVPRGSAPVAFAWTVPYLRVHAACKGSEGKGAHEHTVTCLEFDVDRSFIS